MQRRHRNRGRVLFSASDVDGVDAELELRRLEGGARRPADHRRSDHHAGAASVFKMPNTPVRNSASKIAPGIDVRGDGGYVLAPPSIHPSGRAYAWSVDSANAIVPAPDWLLARITGHATAMAR